jgi:hypothetical protein
MPELVPDSTATLPPPQDPPTPSAYDWEDHLAFRETFLLHFTQEGDRETLERLGRMLYGMALESSRVWPEWRETTTRAEMRAVLADLRHAEAVLATIARSRHVSSLGEEDERLSLSADELARMVGRTGSIIESIIGPFWKGGKRLT